MHCKYPKSQCNAWNAQYAKKEAGCKFGHKCKHRNTSYILIGISINGKVKTYKAHRLAWLYMNGKFPRREIDHIDQNGLNNKWNNLREVSTKENQKNVMIRSNNISGFNGVRYKDKKWEVHIGIDGKNTYGGRFSKLEDAIKRRKELNVEYEFHENHGKKRKVLT